MVSGYAGGAAYIIPAYQIVQDIQRLLGEYVEFPKRQHLDRAVDKAQESLPIGRASMTPGPPPPPLSSIRTGPAPPPTPPGMHMGPAPTPPSPGMCGPMFIRQQSIRIQDLTPPKVMDESVCLKKLTTYSAYTIRKCPPRDPKKGRGTWARAEVIEENLSQEEIIKQIKKLNEKGRSVGDKKKALAPNQQGQVTALITDLVSKETDKAFEWSLVQLDSIVKPVSSKKGKRGGALYETVTMTIFAKRAPLKDLNPVILLQNIEKMKAESMRALKPPPQAGGKSGTSHEAIFELDRKSTKKPAQGRSKKFNEDDYSSTDDSFDSDTDSLFSYGSESFVTSISSKSRSTSRRHSIGNLRSYSRHREFRTAYNTEQPGHPFSPDLHSEAFGASPRPHVPDDPTIMASASFDPVAAAYEAGKADFEAERHGTADRIFPQPVERVIGRVVDPRPGGSYKSRETHYSETRYDPDNRSLDDRRQDESFLRRREEADEEYIESRLDGRVGGRRPSRPSDFVDRTDSFYDRRPSKPTIWDNRHPFAPPPVSRRYPPSSESDPPSMISDRTSTSNTSAPPSDSGW